MRWALAVVLCLLLATPAEAAPVGTCRDRITGAYTIDADGTMTPSRFKVRSADLNLGPIAFTGLKRIRAIDEWDSYVNRDQWIKSVALVRPGARVTLTVPEEQRAWMQLAYAHTPDPVYEVTLVGCRRVRGAKARRRECGPGPVTTCVRDRTPFSGGFEIDYAAAPEQGRCAELLVKERGKPTRRVRPFVGPGDCV